MSLFRRYRFLLVIFVLAGMRAVWEAEGLRDDQIAETTSSLVIEIYPDSAEAHYQRGMIARFVRRDDPEARRHFEQALATGIKTNEDLLYEYAVVLAVINESPKTVDAAIANWRRNYPQSKRPDPRVVARNNSPGSGRKPAYSGEYRKNRE